MKSKKSNIKADDMAESLKETSQEYDKEYHEIPRPRVDELIRCKFCNLQLKDGKCENNCK